MVLMCSAIRRACMHARTSIDTAVELCEKDRTEQGDEHRCGKPVKSLRGARPAVHDWQSRVTRTMKDLRFKQGRASPCVFWHRQRDIKALVHGDDFVSSGESLQKEFETKMVMVGEDDDLAKEVRVPNRNVR